jgi:hypothetical protein
VRTLLGLVWFFREIDFLIHFDSFDVDVDVVEALAVPAGE